MPSDYAELTTMIQSDGEAEQLSLDYREKANDYQATIDYAPRVSAENFLDLKTEQKNKAKPPSACYGHSTVFLFVVIRAAHAVKNAFVR